MFFLKGNKNILLSLILIVVIPVLLSFHTLYFLNKFDSFNAFNQQKRAVDILNLIGELIKDKNSEDLDSYLSQLIYLNPEISVVNIIEPLDNNNFKVVYSSNKGEIGKNVNQEQYILALSLKQPISRKIKIYDEQDSSYNSYLLISRDYSFNKKDQVLNVLISLKEFEFLSKDIVVRSYIFLVLILIFVMILVLNHTELLGYVNLAQKLKKFDEAKNEFISVASHELRTPVASIMGYLDLFKGDVFGKLTEDQKDAVSKIEKIAGGLSELIEDLLEISRIESGKINIEKSKVDPVLISKKVYEILKPKADLKSLDFNFRYPEQHVPRIEVDSGKLEEILMNLGSNAIKYTLKGKVDFVLDYNKTKKEISFKIKDTGVGIAPEEQEHLFSKFYRIRDDATRGITGTGLGLWITKNLTQLMNGKIYFQSLRGAGSEFLVIFSAIDKEEDKG